MAVSSILFKIDFLFACPSSGLEEPYEKYGENV